MSDSLLAWYEREQIALRPSWRKLIDEYPQLARHMSLSYNSAPDPHVARILESFALLNARLSRQLSENSTLISNNLLQIFFPQVLQSLPSVSLLQVSPSKDLKSVVTLPSGTRFRAYIDDIRFCEFYTSRDLQLCPFDIVKNAIHLRPFNLALNLHSHIPAEASAMVKIDLAMLDEATLFNQLPDFPELAIYFQGKADHLSLLYDYLFRNRFSVVLIDDEGVLVPIPETCFLPVGMVARNRMMTHESTIYVGDQMVMEALCWPELFFGFRLLDFGEYFRSFACNRVSLLVFIEDMPEELALSLNDIEFKLGCAPLVNLFEQVAEPVVVDHRQLDYPLIPDSHSPNQLEIHSVASVMDVTGEHPEVVPPLSRLKHNDIGCNKFWIYNSPDRESDQNGWLALVCPDAASNQNETIVLSPHLVCSNGNQVLEIPEHPELECLDSISLFGEARMLMRPTTYIRRSPNIKNRFDILEHLKDSFASAVLSDESPVDDFRTSLKLYHFNNNPYSRAWLDSLVTLKGNPQVAPIRIGNYQCFTEGFELILELNPDQLKQSSLMMFVNLLDNALASFAGSHSFIQLVVRLKGEPGDYVRCIRRHGYQVNR